jgi:NTE family protein
VSLKKAGGPAGQKPVVVLVLQGGGALGAYHIGAYQALEEAGYRPDWVSGISIGAINSAILVGNEPGQRLDRLEELWQEISRDDSWGRLLHGATHKWFNVLSNGEALLFGQPNFFTPRVPSPYLAPAGSPGATSFYDTSPLRATLQRLANFNLINAKTVRISLGATNVTSGNMTFFDNMRQTIGPEHVMASGSLPPGFPAIPIGRELYWDGGCVSNTPLEAVLDDPPATHTIVFMIDLWSAQGKPPRTMDDVLWRQKQIQYASRTAHSIEAVAAKLNLRHAAKLLGTKESDDAVAVPSVSALVDDQQQRIDIVHITYHPAAEQIPQSDAEFSRPSIAERRAAGYRDLKQALATAPWQTTDKPRHISTLVHKVDNGVADTPVAQPRSTVTTGIARPAA